MFFVRWSEGGEETAGEGGNAGQIDDDDEEDEEEVSEDTSLGEPMDNDALT